MIIGTEDRRRKTEVAINLALFAVKPSQRLQNINR